MRRLVKVVAYITRPRTDGSLELLVFDHRDEPEAGTQVPAGTVEPGEAIEHALLREVTEETGLEDLQVLRKLTVYDWFHPIGSVHERHVFHLAAPQDAPESWQWIETSGGEVPEHEGYVYVFRWVPLNDPPELAGNQGDYLYMLRG